MYTLKPSKIGSLCIENKTKTLVMLVEQEGDAFWLCIDQKGNKIKTYESYLTPYKENPLSQEEMNELRENYTKSLIDSVFSKLGDTSNLDPDNIITKHEEYLKSRKRAPRYVRM